MFPLEDPDWNLRWPRELFIGELKAVRNMSAEPGNPLQLLLREAFSGPGPADALEVPGVHRYDPTLSGMSILALGIQHRRVVDEFIARQSEIREEVRAPYRIDRVRLLANESLQGPNWERAKDSFVDLFETLDSTGYFDRAWGADCVDSARPRAVVTAAFTRALGVEELYPFVPATWTQDLFLSVVEVVHDVAARPRIITRHHDFSGCGDHYGSFAAGPGQAVFRLRMNRILGDCRIPYRISESGADRGRVVAVSDEAREDLLVRAPSATSLAEQDEISHAIALFRAHDASREHKRSAVTVLARVLETHRAALKAALIKKDEGALFQIANEFDIRHRKGGQNTDYDEAFLDWIFWWYLGTIELLKHLGERDAATKP